jgi:hypothetical protein
MRHLHTFTGFASALAVAMLAASSAPAANGDKVYVALGGNDANNCFTPATACRSAQRGINQVNPMGTVVFDPLPVFDAGTATVNKPLTLDFQGNQMDVPLAGNPLANLIINTGSGNDIVTIDGLRMNGLGANRNGIQVNKGSLSLRDVIIQNFDRSGLLFQPNANSRLFISDLEISNVGNGIHINGRSGADVIGVIDDTNIFDTTTGIRSTAASGSLHNIAIQNSTISGNTVGIFSSGAGSNVRVKDSTLFGNGTGLSHPSNGLITSVTGNLLTGNTANGTFTGTVSPQ